MRIALACAELGHGAGIDSYTQALAPALAAEGHEVHVIAGAGARDVVLEGVVIDAAHRTPRGTPRTVERVTAAAAVARRLGALGPFDVLEAPDFLAEGLLVALRGRTPVVLHLHTPVGLTATAPGLVRRFDSRVADRLEQAAARRAAVVTVPSLYFRDLLRRTGWLGDIDPIVVRNPVDVSRFETVRPVAETGPELLFIGRLDDVKAPETLIEAAAILRSDIPQVRVTMVGRENGSRDGLPYAAWLERHAARLGVTAEFTGPQSPQQVKERLAAARALALPSSHESFGIVAIEAMAAGRPVVTTTSCGSSEVIAGTGAGAVVAPHDAAQLASALLPYLRDAERAAQAGDIGRSVAAATCGAPVVAKRRAEIYRSAALKPT